MELITKVRAYTKEKDGIERQMVCINDKHHLSLKQITSVGYSMPKALVGSSLDNVVYYAKDEVMLNKAKCTSDNAIIKSFEVVDSAFDLQFAKMANAGLKMSFN